jgi:hypothetical protein
MNPFTCKSGNILVSLDYILRYYVHTSIICLTYHNVAATAPAIQLSTSNTDRRYPAKGDTINYIYTNTQQEQQEQEPKAITMAEELKHNTSLQKKAKLGDGSNIAAEDR